MRSNLLKIVSAAVLATCAFGANAALIANGDFELPVLPTNSDNAGSQPTAIPSWSLNAGSAFVKDVGGNQFANINPSGGTFGEIISTDLGSFTVPSIISYSFSVLSGFGNFSIFDAGSNFVWTSLSGLTAGSYTGNFLLNAPYSSLRVDFFTNTGLQVDNVDISASVVPEPGSTAMLMAGLGALGFMARRRKAK